MTSVSSDSTRLFEQHKTEGSQPVEQFLRVLACFDGLPILGFDLVAMGGLLLCASDHSPSSTSLCASCQDVESSQAVAS